MQVAGRLIAARARVKRGGGEAIERAVVDSRSLDDARLAFAAYLVEEDDWGRRA